MKTTRHTQQGLGKTSLLILIVIIAGAWWFFNSDASYEVKKQTQLKTAEVIGNIAARNMPSDVAGGFHQIPIELRQLADNIYQASGIANTHMITTDAGSVLFDSGISIQAAQQIKIMKENNEGN